MKINNVILKDIDMLEKDVAKTVEEAIERVIEVSEECKEMTILSEIIEKQCIAIMDFFNEIWGEGTDKKLFGNKTNLGECLKAFREFKIENDKIAKKQLDSIKF